MITAVGGHASTYSQPIERRKIVDDGSFSKLVVSDGAVRASTADERKLNEAGIRAAEARAG